MVIINFGRSNEFLQIQFIILYRFSFIFFYTTYYPVYPILCILPTIITLKLLLIHYMLIFNLPKKVLPGYQYEAKIFDHKKKLLWEIKDLKPVGRYETFSIACYRTMFEEDKYLLRVYELGEDGERTGEEYMYSFMIIKEIKVR